MFSETSWASVYVDLHFVRGSLDLHLGDPRVTQALLHELADLDVLVEPLGIILLLVPLGVPGLDDSEPKTNWMNFLAQRVLSFGKTPSRISYFFFASANTT